MVFHKILKSGCRAEQVRLITAPRQMNLLTVFCILSWRIFWLTMTNRIAPEADPDGVFTNLELRILDRLVNNNSTVHRGRRKLSHYLIKLARLGGYLARNGDSPPGNETIWKGLTRLIDIQLGVIIGAGFVGMYGPPPYRKRKMKVTGWSAQMYTTFFGVCDSWPGWNALRPLPI